MKLMELVVETQIAHPGMTIRQFFAACVAADVPGLPYQDASGKIVGKASIRDVLKQTCIPEYIVKHARLLGDQLDALEIPELKARRILDLAIDDFILSDYAEISPNSPVTKALAVMEHHDTPYSFVIDEHGAYHGTLSTMGLAKHLLAVHG